MILIVMFIEIFQHLNIIKDNIATIIVSINITSTIIVTLIQWQNIFYFDPSYNQTNWYPYLYYSLYKCEIGVQLSL